LKLINPRDEKVGYTSQWSLIFFEDWIRSLETFQRRSVSFVISKIAS
jgi:hypothetical protein